MKATKNYYFILGVSRDAHQAEIEAAFESWRATAAFDKFQASMAHEMTEAYECLSDPNLRKKFDEVLGGPPHQINTPFVNVHNLGSHEAGVSLEIKLNRARRKQKSIRRFVRSTAVVLIIAAAAGFGIRNRDKFFPKMPPLPEVPVIAEKLLPARKDPEPEPAPVKTGTVRRSQPVMRTYEVQTGGVVVRDRAPCRPQPSLVSRALATMTKDTPILISKEARDESGNLWYYVKCSQFEGWAFAGDIRVYKY